MPRSARKSWRVRTGLAAGAGVILAVAGLAGSGGSAWASTHSPAKKGHGKSGHSSAKRFPRIGNATNLTLEPVVHPSKSKPPKKLEVKNLVVGTGAAVTASSSVSVVYVGASYKTGKDFTQASWTAKKATTFPLSGVVAGFREGLVGMKVGGRREIVIPPKLGYGNHSYGPISAGETLVFVVDLKGVSG